MKRHRKLFAPRHRRRPRPRRAKLYTYRDVTISLNGVPFADVTAISYSRGHPRAPKGDVMA